MNNLVELERPKNYVKVNLDLLSELIKNPLIKTNDLAYLLKMMPLVKTDMCFLYNGSNKPHTYKTLQKYLEIKSNKTFIDLMNRLEESKAIYKYKDNGRQIKIIINPLLSKRRVTFNSKLYSIFEGIEEESNERKKQYNKYIQSEDWKMKREELFEDRGKQCEKCGSINHLQVHHLTYENFGNESLEDLQILCRGCHLELHDLI